MRSRATAIVVAVVIPLAVLAGVVVLRGGSSDGPAKLPISLGAAGESRAVAADIALAPYPGVVYRAADGLPTLEGTGRAYKVVGSVDAAAAQRVASAFDLAGESVADDYGGFSVTDGDAQVTVFPYGGGGWSYVRSTSGGGVSSSGVAVACPADATECPVPETTIPERPASLPSEDEARKLALEALGRLGMDTDNATVSSVDLFSQWMVNVAPVIDGVPTEGFGATVTIGADGVVEYANGALGRPDAGDEYPLIGTAEAIDNLNEGKGFGGPIPLVARDAAASAVAGEAGDSIGGGEASGSPGSPPDAPVPTEVFPVPPCDGTGAPTTLACSDVTIEPFPPDTSPPGPPVEVTITAAERILLAVGSYDGNDLFLVPGYRFTYGQDPSFVPVLAIDESFIAPPPTVTDPATDDVKTDPGSSEPGAPGVIEPQPAPDCPPIEPAPDGQTTTIPCQVQTTTAAGEAPTGG